jgi:hypothetical protein
MPAPPAALVPAGGGGAASGRAGYEGAREIELATLDCRSSTGSPALGPPLLGAVTSAVAGGGAAECVFEGVTLPPGAVGLLARAAGSSGTFDSEVIPTPRPTPDDGVPDGPLSPGQCASVSDTFVEPPDPDASGLLSPQATAPRGAPARDAASGVWLGKAPDDATDEGGARRVCTSTVFEYTARFGPFVPTACGTYAVRGPRRARGVARREGKGGERGVPSLEAPHARFSGPPLGGGFCGGAVGRRGGALHLHSDR